jgi:parallel beta-helix repeat protein/predicted outer membrane repeat protein
MRFIHILVFTLILIVPFNAYAQIHIGGEISGVLEDTTYIVDDFLRITVDDTLTIEPGAIFLFAGNYQLQVYGLLLSIGIEGDSIYFMPQDSLMHWGCVYFDENCNDLSELAYCYITGCVLGAINCYGADVTIFHCTLEGNTGSWGGGIYLSNSSPIISTCKISGNSVINNGGGIYATYSSPQITNCIISENHCDGFGSGMGGGGICFNHSSSGSLLRCSVIGNSTGHYGGGIACSDMSDAEIRNCTIFGNSAELSGGGVEIYYSDPNISNNIISDNTGNGGINFEILSNVLLTYNDFYNNENGNFVGGMLPAGLGELTTINNNGDSCDVFMNIFMDPCFLDSANQYYHLQANSPCIDAGDPASPLDPDSTLSDIGAFYFDQSGLPVDNLIITISNSDIILQWGSVPLANSYNIYRSTAPYFDITGLNPIATETDTSYIDINALNEGKYFYRVTYEY